MRFIFALAGTVLLVGCGTAIAPEWNGEASSSSSSSVPSRVQQALDDLIQVDDLSSGQTVESPLKITGAARGTWYFEASFPVEILDGNGKQLAIVPAQAQGDWMTEDWVPFVVELRFNKPVTTAGTVIFHKDNPSGEPEFDRELEVPVQFN